MSSRCPPPQPPVFGYPITPMVSCWVGHSGTSISGGTDRWFWFGDMNISIVEDHRFGLYNGFSQDLDDIAWNYPNYLICRSAGNDRDDLGPPPGTEHLIMMGSEWQGSTDVRDPDGDYDSLGPRAVAKNVLIVGAVDDIVGGYAGPAGVSMTAFSSWGPTDDGRIKPDIIGNGVNLFSASDTTDIDYRTETGTSMAAPNVSGSLGVLIQHWRNTHPTEADMRSATLKGLVLHTADEAGTAIGPDYQHGWGLMNTLAAANTITSDISQPMTISEWDLLTNGDSVEFQITTDGSSSELRATICWTDPAGTPPGNLLDPPNKMLVNDLDLRLERTSSGTTYLPWVLNPAIPSAAATTGDNNTDNIEQIVVDTPGTDSFILRVTHKGTLSGGSQSFSIIMTGGLQADGCPNDPNKMDPGVCGCGVSDTDSDGDGVPDCVDQCPGAPDIDTDGDGVLDCNDGCPTDPNKTVPGACGCGVADMDSDSDGTPDCVDGCPTDPNKIVPGFCGCGVSDVDSDSDGIPDCIDQCTGGTDVDTDGDGVLDCNDGCPMDPNKISPGLCGCGVLDTDTDFDGTPDCLDMCPMDPNKTQPGQCGCGNPDTDMDGDGWPDCIDGCPNDPDKTMPGACGCGQPDSDTDGDGVADCIDRCPIDPNKTAQGQCGCGISDTDTDSDGTADCNDECPNDPNKTIPGACGCGQADTDTDGDGTADCDDGCPMDPNKTLPGICGCEISDVDSDGDGVADCLDQCAGSMDIDTDGDGVLDCHDDCPLDPNKTGPDACGCGLPETDTDGDGAPDCQDLCPTDPDKTNSGVCGCGVPDGNLQPRYRDFDRDGYGDPGNFILACHVPTGYVDNPDDCDDKCSACHPGAPEVQDEKDNDCDGIIDEPGTGTTRLWYRDADNDGYGDPVDWIETSVQPAGYVEDNTDCDDGNPVIHPGSIDTCSDGVDNNCDGLIDNQPPDNQPAGNPCGVGLCASGTCTMMPIMLAGWAMMKKCVYSNNSEKRSVH